MSQSRSLPLPFVWKAVLLAALIACGAAPASAQPIARADVDRDCTVTRADATLVQGALGKRTGQAGFSANADVNSDGVINAVDLAFVNRNLNARVCAGPPPDAPTIAASVAPAANSQGWHNTDVTVSFTCTNATSCPAPIVIATEGAAQVVERTVTNSAGASATARVTLNIDKTPPLLVTPPLSSVLPGATLPVPVTVTDPLSGPARTTLIVRRSLADSRTTTPFALAWTVPADATVGLEEPLEIIAEDRAGNVASLRRTVLIDRPDTVPPTVTVRAPATAAPGATVPVVVEATDDRTLAGVALARNDGTTTVPVSSTTAAPFSFQAIAQIPEGLAAGTVITFAATATDAAGNSGSGLAEVRVVTSVQTTALQVVVDPPVSPTFQTSGVITGTIGRATGTAPPTAPPIIASVAPQTGRQGQTLDVVITGINTVFSPLSQATFGPGLTVTSVTPQDDTHLLVRLAIAGNATRGPRLVAVSTGNQEGLLANAFSVVSGLGTLSGRLLNAQGQPIASAQICLQGTTTCVTTDADGRFTFTDVPVDARRVVASAPGYDTATLPIALTANGSATLGDVALAVSDVPPPPPLPNSPPVAPRVAAALGRGATEFKPGGNPEQLRKLIRDTIIAVGGKELGVLDETGRQLNPLMAGAGYASFTNEAVEELANDMIAGDTISLAELFKIFMGSLKFPESVPLPTLQQLILGFQDSVNQAWADPARPDAPMLILLFNQGRVTSATPPIVNFDTRFNPLQKNLLASSFMIFVTRYLNDPQTMGERLDVVPALAPRLAQPRGGSFLDRLRGVASLVNPALAGTSSAARGAWRSSWTGPRSPRLSSAGLRDSSPAFAVQGGPPPADSNPYLPDDAPASRPPSLMWASVVEKVLPAGGWTVAKQAGSLCDDFLVYVAGKTQEYVDGKSLAGKELAKDPLAKIKPMPGCKDAISLLEILASSRSAIYTAASAQVTKFLGSEAVTAVNAQRVQQAFKSESYQAAWAAAKKEAGSAAVNQKLLGFARGFAEGYLSKLQGEVVNGIFKLETELFIQSIRPRMPFLVGLEQMVDAEKTPAEPSRIIKVTFDRSPNDQGIYDTPDITWYYELYRGRSGAFEPVQVREFRKADKRISFYDTVPEDGTYVYRVRGLRLVGQPLGKTPEPSFTDKVLKFLSGFLPSAVSIAGHQVIGLGVVQTVADPLATIYRGINVQASDFSDPEQLYVSTRPPQPRPPASLAVHPFRSDVYLSVPLLGSIFKIEHGLPTLFAQANFKAPNQVGLAIDIRGDLYTDNSASDAEFGGRIFKFDSQTGARTLAGSTNYYSLLIQFANPVSVQSMVAARGPYGEQLFIADSLNQRITSMTLPWNTGPGVPAERNISQPYAQSPLFQFGPTTTLAMRYDLTLVATQNDNVLLIGPYGSNVRPLFTEAGGAAPSPYTQLSGVTFDTYGNMYVSDLVEGTISMIPLEHSKPFQGLEGLSPVQRKKLTVLRGSRRPSDIKLAPDRDGLAFYDGERAFSQIRFGMAGQVTDSGGAPIANAQVYIAALRKIAVTDADGVFVMADLVEKGKDPILDFTVRVNGQTQSYRAVLDTYKHNVVDVVFNPTPPPTSLPPPPPPPVINPPIPGPPQVKPSGPETVGVVFDLQTRPQSAPEACPRGVFLAPAFGAGSLTASTTVTGVLTTTRVSSALLLVNGVASTVPLTDREFSTSAPLNVGENVLTIALPASVLKPLGCADLTLDDEAPVSISTTHKLFHDPRQEELERYRRNVGFDLSVRGIVREGGRPIAGLGFHVPGTDYEARTDGDGVFQVNLPKGTLGGATTSADVIAGQLFTRIGSIVALLRNEQRAAALDALSSLLLQAVATADAPPPAAVSVEVLLARILEVEGTARRLILALESAEGIPDPADVDALEALGPQLAATTSNGDIVVKGREYPELSITVRVR